MLKKISSTILAIALLLTTYSSALAWRFVVVGDTRSGHTRHSEVMEGIIKKVPNSERVTLINVGDITAHGEISEWQIWQKVVDGNYASFQTPGGLGINNSKTNPPDYIGAVGNHDIDTSNWVANWRNFLPAQRDVTAYSDIPGHADGLYGSYIYDNTLFLWVASSGRPSGQETYMEKILQRAKSDSKVVWKFVFFHHPPISCGSGWSLGRTWHDNYFVPNGVDIVFVGHAHYYIRTCPITSASSKSCDEGNRGTSIGDSNGVIHVITGGGGANLSTLCCTSKCSSHPWLEVGAKRYHFMEITIQGGNLIMKAWDPTSSATNPTLLDELTINKGPITTPTIGPSPTPVPQSAYPNGVPHAIPGKIEAEDFDRGGPEVAYHDYDTGNNGQATYRQGEDVDLSSTPDSGGGYHIGWTEPNEWVEYTVNVQSSGIYKFQARLVNNSSGGQFRMEMDGSNVTGSITVPDTGGWSNWQTIEKEVNLSSGEHIMRVYYEKAAVGGAYHVGDHNWFNFVKLSTLTPTPQPDTPGDGNNDGLVDGKDFIIWLSHFGQNVSGPSNGDYDNNGQVRISDYIVWVKNY